MADTLGAQLTPEQRREIIIEAALDYMGHQDWYYAEGDDDPVVLAELEHLYAADLEPTPCSGGLLFDTGVTLALLWADERRAEYERALPTWSCDCGAVYKRDRWAAQHEVVYSVTSDGLFDEMVGSTRGKRGVGSIPRDDYAMNNGGCPSCLQGDDRAPGRPPNLPHPLTPTCTAAI